MAIPQDKDTSKPKVSPKPGEDIRNVGGDETPEFLSADDDPQDEVELAGEDSFPASDPPSNTPIRRQGAPKDDEHPERKSPSDPKH